MHDRVSGKPATQHDERAPSLVINGRFINREMVEYLVTDGSGRWHVARGMLSAQGELEGRPLPGEETLLTIKVLASVEPFTFTRLKRELPLLPRSNRDDLIDSRDDDIREAYDSLESIAQVPRTQLTRDVEVVPIGRVRRVTPRAMIHLAAHSEHWGRRTVSHVEPSRMLAEFVEEDLDFYENRVVAEAVQRSAELLDRRIRNVGDVADFFDSLDRLSKSLLNRPHGVTRRVSEQFEGLEDGLDPAPLRAILDELLEVRGLVGQLLDSSFMRRVTRLGGGRESLYWTNILVDDDRYSVAGGLLDALSKEPTRSPEEQVKAAQSSCSEWASYVALAIVRSLARLGWIADSEVELGPGVTMGLTRPVGGTGQIALLRWDADDTFVIESTTDHGRSIRLIPLLQPLQAIALGSAALRAWSSLHASALQRSEDMVLLLYPRDAGTTAEWPADLARRFNTLGHESATPSRVGFLPIGPLEADTVERLSRGLGWLSRGWLFTDTYPVAIKTTHKNREVIAELFPSAVQKFGKDGLALRKRVTPEQAVAALHQAHRTKARGAQLSSEPDHDDDVREALADAVARLERLAACPVCETLHFAQAFETRDNATFWATCPNCETEWGTRICLSCHSPYPVLIPPGISVESQPYRADWIEFFFGSETCAAPCARRDREFICPHCGNCSGSGPSTDCECHSIEV